MSAPSPVSSDYERLRKVTLWSLAMMVLVAWLGAGLAVFAAPWPPSTGALVFPVAALIAFSVLYLRAAARAVEGCSPVVGELTAAGLLSAAVILSQGAVPWSWGVIGAAWTGMVAFGGTLWRVVAASAATGAICFVAALGSGDPFPALFNAVFMSAMLSGANRFQLWFWKVVKAANEGKEAQARLAVTEERLRFSRDLHDLVGHSLSAIAVKSEVATKLAAADPARAAAEMAEVRRLAREALREIRTAVRGYRTVDFQAELHSVRAVLDAAGIRCALTTPAAEVPAELGTLLAWVVREGTTNVLRHSTATRCRIEVTVDERLVTLEMVNDGAGAGGARGTGLDGLAERVAAFGGEVTAGPADGGEFVLRAVVPTGGIR
ncbi:histidine kinase [Streptosporangium soli]|nr:histidine kinase [Streptosporangium sp. KLBMP 9127]